MSITRVRWRERQIVAAADLIAEQDYRLRALGRHHLAPHGWGVIRGLWLTSRLLRRRVDWQVHPGVAIDGYGRALVVTRPIDFTIPLQGSFRVFLYYCEARVSRPPCVPCADQPLPRVGQYVQLVVEQAREPLTGDGVTLDLARAAGPVPGYPAWPVLLGTVKADGDPKVDHHDVRYHRQRASVLVSPSGRALLRLGLLGPEDAYHLLLATASGTPRPVRRLGIDRDGGIHVWRPLAIMGPKASGLVQLSRNAVLSVEADMPTGFGRRVLLMGRLENPAQPLLTVNWRDTLGLHLQETVALKPARRVYLEEQLRFGGASRVSLKVLSSSLRTRKSIIDHPRDNPEHAQLIAESFEVELLRSGGRLRLEAPEPRSGPQAPEPCDPVPEDTAQETKPAQPTGPATPVVQLLAAAAYTPGPLAREVYTQSTPAPDGTPATECRISGGAFDGGDRTSRVGFGVRVDDGTNTSTLRWQPLLTMDGGGRVAMPCADTVLHVDRTLQLPPITTDPADPLTQDLLALAYNAGLRRVNKIVTAPAAAISAVSSPVAQGGALSYTLTFDDSTIKVKRILEIIYGTGTNGDWILRSITVPADLKTGHQVTLSPFWRRGATVKLRIEMLVSDGGKDRAASAEWASQITT